MKVKFAFQNEIPNWNWILKCKVLLNISLKMKNASQSLFSNVN